MRYRSSFTRTAAVLLGLSVHAAHLGAQTVRDSANAAWLSGRTNDAARLYSLILQQDSTDEAALHRVALTRAWAEHYDESLGLFDRLLRADPQNTDARLDRARVVAWSGNPKAAIAAIDSILIQNPRNVDALQARAQLLSWAGNYSEALRGYDRILEITPDNRALRIDRARVLSWAEKFGSARAVYDSLLTKNPADREALLGLANIFTLRNRNDSASVIYERMLAQDPHDIDAMRGAARAATWAGNLLEAERLWQDALAVAPTNVDVLVGYAQALRWEGRDAAAGETLARARAIAPTNADVREQMRWVDLALATRASTSITYETDSDHNRIRSSAISGATRATKRVEIRGDAYERRAEDATFGKTLSGVHSYGASLGAWIQLEPGWALAASAGGTKGSRHSAVIPSLHASLTTPGRYTQGMTLSIAYSALDGSAALIDKEVAVTEGNIDVHTALHGVSISAAAGIARFYSRVSESASRRWSALAVANRNLNHTVAVGLRARGFGFAKDLNDGYFDPDFYGLLELTGRFLHEKPHWSVSLEAAPGVQQVRSSGDPSGSFRINGRVAYLLRPGRTIAFTTGYAKSGLQQISPTAGADYKYSAFGLSLGWAF